MSDKKTDIEADIPAAKNTTLPDRGETIGMMEPVLIGESSKHRGELSDLALELAAKSAGFRRSLPEGVLTALADLVRAMNCYYSNLIEGHDTHPIEIERALKNDYSNDRRKRDLQMEAKAHITVQKWIDAGGLAGRATSAEGILETHRRFCELLPEDLLQVTEPDTREVLRVVPGELRLRDVAVGRHVPVSPGALPRFMRRFEDVYARLGRTDSILASAAAHHRLLWIHPFLDGNGRVARLMSHAMLLQALDTGGVWSIARGLARNVATYKGLLTQADLPRRNDLDGRGTLSEEALAEFTKFFLTTCLDQVRFMEELVEPNRLHTRIMMWAEEEIRLGNLPQQSGAVLEAVLFRGALPRGDVGNLLGQTDRHGRRIVQSLMEHNVIASDGPREALRLAFPATLASRWMPGLFPDRTG